MIISESLERSGDGFECNGRILMDTRLRTWRYQDKYLMGKDSREYNFQCLACPPDHSVHAHAHPSVSIVTARWSSPVTTKTEIE